MDGPELEATSAAGEMLARPVAQHIFRLVPVNISSSIRT